jgi:hypothetical protein
VFRGDRNRNVRLGRLRELARLENTIVGIDLADRKQMVVVYDHDSKVLARRTFRYRVWDLGFALDLGGRAGRGEGVRRGDGVVRADRTPSAASSEQDMIKRWIHMDTHSRILAA